MKNRLLLFFVLITAAQIRAVCAADIGSSVNVLW